MNTIITHGLQTGNSDQAAPKTSLLVLGVGNILLTDDGVGPKAAEALQARFPEDAGIAFLDGGTLSFTLADTIADHDGLIVIDACELVAEPGTIRLFEGAEMDAHMLGGRRSVHEVALSDLLDMVRLRGALPERRALVGIQPLELSWGLELSAPVAAGFASLCAEVEALIGRWRP